MCGAADLLPLTCNDASSRAQCPVQVSGYRCNAGAGPRSCIMVVLVSCSMRRGRVVARQLTGLPDYAGHDSQGRGLYLKSLVFTVLLLSCCFSWHARQSGMN